MPTYLYIRCARAGPAMIGDYEGGRTGFVFHVADHPSLRGTE